MLRNPELPAPPIADFRKVSLIVQEWHLMDVMVVLGGTQCPEGTYGRIA